MTTIYVDADACPVKEEIYRVAPRHRLQVILVTNLPMSVPGHPWLRLETVAEGADMADDWIAEQAGAGDIVITADIPLADRCLKKQASVLSPRGKVFDADNIGAVLAMRDLMSDLRDSGEITGGGPPAFDRKHRSRFLHRLNETVIALRRAGYC